MDKMEGLQHDRYLLLYVFFVIYWIYGHFIRILFYVNYHYIKINELNHSKNKKDISLFN